jgi:hypothetical protein
MGPELTLLAHRQGMPVAELKKKVISGHAAWEKIAEHADGIIFTENEIDQAGKASSDA